MVKAKMASNSAQVHPVHIQLERFPAHLFWVGPGFGFWSVLDLAEHAALTLAATLRFSGSVLVLCSVTFWTFNHALILAQVLATPRIRKRTNKKPVMMIVVLYLEKLALA